MLEKLAQGWDLGKGQEKEKKPNKKMSEAVKAEGNLRAYAPPHRV